MEKPEPKKIHHRPINLVSVTLDRHLSSSVARAQQTLRARVPGLSISVHAAAEWSASPKASARMANRLLEAHGPNCWEADEATLSALRNAADEREDRLEGIGIAVA